MDEDANWYGGRHRPSVQSPDDIVLDVLPAPAQKGHSSALFRPMSIVATVAHLSYC